MRDFLAKASHHAKQQKLTQLNILEADLIVAQEDFLDIQKRLSRETIVAVESKLQTLRDIVKNKKKEYE